MVHAQTSRRVLALCSWRGSRAVEMRASQASPIRGTTATAATTIMTRHHQLAAGLPPGERRPDEASDQRRPREGAEGADDCDARRRQIDPAHPAPRRRQQGMALQIGDQRQADEGIGAEGAALSAPAAIDVDQPERAAIAAAGEY